jgi:hypothetical protein
MLRKRNEKVLAVADLFPPDPVLSNTFTSQQRPHGLAEIPTQRELFLSR